MEAKSIGMYWRLSFQPWVCYAAGILQHVLGRECGDFFSFYKSALTFNQDKYEVSERESALRSSAQIMNDESEWLTK